MAPSFDWWAKEGHRGTPVVIKMENTNWSMVELEGPSEEDFLIGDSPVRTRDKFRNKNVKQLTWVLLLKAHKAAGRLTSIASAMVSLGSAIKLRLRSGRTDIEMDTEFDTDAGRENENPTVKTWFYSCIKVFLWLSVLLLGFEMAAYFKGWHIGAPHLQLQYLLATPFGFKDTFDSLYSRCVLIRVEYLAPPLQFLANVCIVLFLIQSLDSLILCVGCFWIRFKKTKPIPKQDAVADLESSESGFFPMVLVQIPMCNEKEVKQPTFGVTGVNNEEDLIWILTQLEIVDFGYFIAMPPIIINWLRVRWYKRKLFEIYLQFMFVFIFFPGVSEKALKSQV